jgi:hypothetical protein
MAPRVATSTAAILSSQQQQQQAEEPINPSHHYQQARGASSDSTKRSSYADVVSSSQGATGREEGRLEEGMAEGLDDEEERGEGRCCNSDGTEGEGEDEEGDDDDEEDRIEVVQSTQKLSLSLICRSYRGADVLYLPSFAFVRTLSSSPLPSASLSVQPFIISPCGLTSPPGNDMLRPVPYRILLLRYLLIVPPLALICLLGLIAMVTFGW